MAGKIGGPWNGQTEGEPQRVKEIQFRDGTVGQIREHNWGWVYRNELGQDFPTPLIAETDKPDIYRIGDGFFRITPV